MRSYIPPRVNILGVNISAINMQQAICIIDDWITNKQPQYVCVTPAHGVMDCQNNPSLRHIFNNSGLTTPDGMGIVWLLKLKKQSGVSRVYGPDLMLNLCEHSVKRGWSHFFYGGSSRVTEALIQKLQSSFPGLRVAGFYCPPFRDLTPQEDQSIQQQLNESKADIVWVGIGTPKQEKWMAEHVGKVTPSVLIGVGAAFDFLSGTKKQAPRWIQRNGLEWLFRLLTEPRRLWRRYIKYPLFALLVFAQSVGLKDYPSD